MSPRPDAAVLALDQGTTGSTAFVFGPERRGPRPRLLRDHAALPDAGLGRARRRGDLGVSARRVVAEALAAAGIGARRARGHRHHEPARDHRGVGPQDRQAGPPRDRLAGAAAPPTICDGAQASGARGARPRAAPGSCSTPTSRAPRSRGSSTTCPALRARAERGELAFGTIDSWLIWKLTGGAVHVTDSTNASRTLLFNIRTRRWDDGALRAARRARRAMLPEVRPSAGRLRRTTVPGPARRGGARSPASPATSRPRSSARAASSRAW